MGATHVKYFFLTVYLGILCIAAIFWFKTPSYNWDMLPYTVMVLKMDHYTTESAHGQAYRLAEQNLSPDRYGLVVDSANAYRSTMAKDSRVFESQLPFYAVKPLYIALCYLSYKAGVDLPHATAAPSVISYILIGLLLFHWLTKYLRLPIALISSVLLMMSPPLIESARLSTPDGLSAFLLLSFFYFILEKPSLVLASIAMMLSVLARLDNLLICFLVLFAIHFSKKWYRPVGFWRFVFMCFLLVIVYFGIGLLASKYGWSALFYGDFAAHFTPQNSAAPQFSVSSYLVVMKERLKIGMTSSHLAIFMSLLPMVFSKNFSFKKMSFDQLFCILIPVALAIRFVLIPGIADRFYIAYYLIIFILLAKTYSPNRQK
jgi:hypothetical protein